MQGHLASELKNRLTSEIPTHDIFIEDSWDLSVDDFAALLADYRNLAKQLLQKGLLKHGPMTIRIAPPRPVTVSMRTSDPYLLAKVNAEYVFRSANQFTRNSPFISIFVIHPWFNQLALHNDFMGNDAAFTRSFARRAFMQFTKDTRLISKVCKQISSATTTFADAADLLSGIIFLNAWPSDLYQSGTPESQPVPSWIYLNPRASNTVCRSTMRMFGRPHATIDDFTHDDY